MTRSAVVIGRLVIKSPPQSLELTEQFNVSRMTVNKAIRDLVSEGKLIRKPRLGTLFVSRRKSAISLLDINNIAQQIKDRGQTYTSQVIKHDSIKADESTATRLGCDD